MSHINYDEMAPFSEILPIHDFIFEEYASVLDDNSGGNNPSHIKYFLASDLELRSTNLKDYMHFIAQLERANDLIDTDDFTLEVDDISGQCRAKTKLKKMIRQFKSLAKYVYIDECNI